MTGDHNFTCVQMTPLPSVCRKPPSVACELYELKASGIYIFQSFDIVTGLTDWQDCTSITNCPHEWVTREMGTAAKNR